MSGWMIVIRGSVFVILKRWMPSEPMMQNSSHLEKDDCLQKPMMQNFSHLEKDDCLQQPMMQNASHLEKDDCPQTPMMQYNSK